MSVSLLKENAGPPDNVSVLNHADLQNTYLSISFRPSLFDFFS